MDLEVAPVHAVVVGDHHLGELHVLVVEGLQHAVELLHHEVDAAEGVLFELAAAVPGSGPACGARRWKAAGACAAAEPLPAGSPC